MNRAQQSRMLHAALAVVMATFLILGPVGCSSTKPRQHWWQFWRPKPIQATQVFNPDEVILPPAPGVIDPSGTGLSGALGDSNTLPPPPVTLDPTQMRETDPIRQAPAGTVSQLQTVYFDYDSDEIRADQAAILDQDAQWILANPSYEIQIGGHTDERGTTEYNFNLGQRRAKSVMAYLVSRGVPAERLHTISYGEEQPIAMGQDESAWSQNRRVQFLVY